MLNIRVVNGYIVKIYLPSINWAHFKVEIRNENGTRNWGNDVDAYLALVQSMLYPFVAPEYAQASC